MQRYDLVHYPCRAYNADVMEVCDDGDYVLFTDAQAILFGYEEALEDGRRLTREIDVLLNGEEGAAKQASLCDLVAQLKKHELGGGILAALSAAEAENRRLRKALEKINVSPCTRSFLHR